MKHRVITKRLGIGTMICRASRCSTIGSLGLSLLGVIPTTSLRPALADGTHVLHARRSIGFDNTQSALRATVSSKTYSTKPIKVRFSWRLIGYWQKVLGLRPKS